MREPDMRIDPLHQFAIEFEYKAQHTVRGRMLRSEIEVKAISGIAAPA